MKKFVFIILVLAVAVYLFGCAKKEEALMEMQEPISIEEITQTTTAPEATPKSEAVATPAAIPSTPLKVVYQKPTVVEIQTALKNAGYYAAAIDGKIGPLTRKAIEDFQKANNLEVDGKVGPKTWAVLSPYLNPQPTPKAVKKR
jgi:peptidoglycan hydrolase-like protein with peptidoglycan-binding domain